MMYDAQYLLGRAEELLRLNKPELARHYVNGALLRNPRHESALYSLACVDMRAGNFDNARRSCARILANRSCARPGLAHLVMGNAARALGEHAAAETAYRAALQCEPTLAEATCNLGATLIELGKPEEALAILRQAAAERPGDAATHANLGLAQQRLGLLTQAAQSLHAAVQLNPGLQAAWLLLGTVLLEQNRVPEAAAVLAEAIARAGDAGTAGVARYNFALAQIQMGQRAEAVESLSRAVVEAPGISLAEGALLYQAQWLCRWDLVERLAPRVLERLRSAPEMVVEPFAALSIPGATRDDHGRAGAAYARRTMPPAPPMVRRGQDWQDGRRRLRVGFLSGDFRSHPTAILMAGLLASLDRSRLEPIALSYGETTPSEFRQACLGACERHVDLNPALQTSSRAAAEAVAAERLDVLLDLQCYTSGTRSELLRFRPAPVQGHYLVYPATAASEIYDFTIFDDVVCPTAGSAEFSEKLLKFRKTFFPPILPRPEVPVPTRASQGLPEGAVVFASMNQSYKIGAEVFRTWCAVLRRVPHSVLWLRSMPVQAEMALRHAMITEGLDPYRLVLAGSAPFREHFARLRLADIGLDTWPYGSHTTAMDLLANGVPMVAMEGDTLPARVSSSILQGYGLGALAQRTPEAFVETAVRLATEPSFSADIKFRVQNAFAPEAVAAALAAQGMEFSDLLLAAAAEVRVEAGAGAFSGT